MSEGAGVGAVVGAGMMLVVVVVLATFAMRSSPHSAPAPQAPQASAPPAQTPSPQPAARPADDGSLRFNDPKNTERYEARRKTLETIRATIPDIAAKGPSAADAVRKECDDASADLGMLGAEPNAKVRAFVDGFKRACEYDAVGAALDMYLARIEAARAKAIGVRPAACAKGEPWAKAVATSHYEDDPAMKDRLERFAKGCL